MSILSYKYKAHKLVNTLFYVVVFGIGFVLGFGAEKIDFNKLISQVLMIDNAKAYTITTTSSGDVINEDFIISKFSSYIGDFNVNDYEFAYQRRSGQNYWDVYAIVKDSIHLGTQDTNGNLNFGSVNCTLEIGKYCYYYFGVASNGVRAVYPASGGGVTIQGSSFNSLQEYNSSFTYNYSTKNVLDFSKYMEVDYWLNDGSIFKDELHQDFKEVCWENFDELMFSVTISSDKEYDVTYHEGQQEGETYIDSGFYVFDDVRKLKRGTRIKTLLQPDYKHDSSTWVSGVTFEHLHNITSEFYLMNKEELLESRYSDPVNALGNYDISRGDSYYYDNLSKLLNATYVGFTYYKNVIDDYRYDIFYLQEEKEKFCIYIPNDFIVTTLSINELGGIYGDVPTHTDKSDTYIDMESVHNNNFSYNSLFSVIKEFIASIRETVSLINGYIYSLFTSFPPLLQMFIITIITLIVIKTILWMVVR